MVHSTNGEVKQIERIEKELFTMPPNAEVLASGVRGTPIHSPRLTSAKQMTKTREREKRAIFAKRVAGK